jgi:hypothetical protein
MANRLLNFAAVVSGAIFLLVLAAWFVAGRIDPRTQCVTVPGMRISVDAGGRDRRLEVYHGSICGLYSDTFTDTVRGDPRERVSKLGDVAGIFFYRIRWPNGVVWWTLSLSLLYPLAVASVLPAWSLIRRSRHPRRGFPVDGVRAAG